MSTEFKIPSITLVKFNDAVGDMIALAKEHPELMTRLVHATKPLHPKANNQAITVPLSESNRLKLNKLSDNLRARNKDNIDISDELADMLDKKLDSLLHANKHPHDELDYYVPDRFKHPKVGDWWNEMCGGYLTIVDVHHDDDFVVMLEIPMNGLDRGPYRFNRKWLGACVMYRGRSADKPDLAKNDFAAWVTRGNGTLPEKLAAWYEENKDAVVDLRNSEPPAK